MIQTRQTPTWKLTPECWAVQFYGRQYCETCEFKDTDECGGQRIRKTGKNEKGYLVPLGAQYAPQTAEGENADS